MEFSTNKKMIPIHFFYRSFRISNVLIFLAPTPVARIETISLCRASTVLKFLAPKGNERWSCMFEIENPVPLDCQPP